MISITNLNIKTLDEVLDLINNNTKPVVFWDTCSLIDIIRLPLPSRKNSLELMTRIIEIKDVILQKKVYSLSSERCIKELSDNALTEIGNYEKELTKLGRDVNTYIDFINTSGFTLTSISPISLNSYKLELYFCDLTQAILNNTIFIKAHNCFQESADIRTVNKMTPAKTKGEYKDCYIWETNLQTRKLHNDKSLLWTFISSNTTDYTNNVDKTNFASDIAEETSVNNIAYASNFNLLIKHFIDSGVI